MTTSETLLKAFKELQTQTEDAINALQHGALVPYICADLMKATKKSADAIYLAESELKQYKPESGES
jgi:hypothetical protein